MLEKEQALQVISLVDLRCTLDALANHLVVRRAPINPFKYDYFCHRVRRLCKLAPISDTFGYLTAKEWFPIQKIEPLNRYGRIQNSAFVRKIPLNKSQDPVMACPRVRKCMEKAKQKVGRCVEAEKCVLRGSKSVYSADFFARVHGVAETVCGSCQWCRGQAPAASRSLRSHPRCLSIPHTCVDT